MLLSLALTLSVSLSSGLQDAAEPPARVVPLSKEPLLQVGVAADSRTLIAIDKKGGIQAYDLRKDEVLWNSQSNLAVEFCIGDKLVAVRPMLTVVSYFELKTGAKQQGLGGTAVTDASALLIDPRDRWAWMGAADKPLLVRLTPKSLNGWSNRRIENQGVTCLAQDAKGNTLAVGGRDGTIRFAGGKSANVDDRKVFESDAGPVLALACDPKMKKVFAGRADGVLEAWDYRSGRIAHVFEGHSVDVCELAIDAKGKLLASADVDGQVRVWDLGKHQLLTVLSLKGRVTSLDLFDKGKALVTSVEGQNMARVWDLSDL